jgi:hypothetical protein
VAVYVVIVPDGGVKLTATDVDVILCTVTPVGGVAIIVLFAFV